MKFIPLFLCGTRLVKINNIYKLCSENMIDIYKVDIYFIYMI